MPLHVVHGNIFESHCQTLVNPVNCVGYMGKGLAKEFKRLSKPAFEDYSARCERGEVKPGAVYVYCLPNGRQILHFPSKRHWRAKSKIEDIRSGLEDIRARYRALNIKSMAMPAIGCGLGGLSWESQVRPLVEELISDLPIEIEVFIGRGASRPDKVKGQETLW